MKKLLLLIGLFPVWLYGQNKAINLDSDTITYSGSLANSAIQVGKVFVYNSGVFDKITPPYNAYLSTDVYEDDSVQLISTTLSPLLTYTLKKNNINVTTKTGSSDTISWGYYGEGTYKLISRIGTLIDSIVVTERDYDADAKTYIDSSGLTNRNLRMSADYLVTTLKSNSLWTGTNALYAMFEDSATSVRNIKDPRNLDVAFRLTPSGTFTYSTTRAIPGTNAYFNTHLQPKDIMSLNSAALAFYSDSMNYGLYTPMGVNDVSSQFYFFDNYTTSTPFFGVMYNASYPLSTPRIARGLTTISRTGATSLKGYNNQTLVKSVSGGGGGTVLPDADLYIGAQNNAGTARYFSTRPIKFAYVGAGLSDEQVSTFSKIIERTRIISEGIDTMITITLDNTGNPHDLNNYVAEIIIDKSKANISTINDDGSNLRFLYNNYELPYYLDYIEKYWGKMRAYVKVTIPANTSKHIYMTWGIETADSSKTFSQIMTRKQPIDSTWAFYKLDDVEDSLGNGEDWTGTNTSFSEVKGISMLTCNGTTAYATLDEDLPEYGWVSFNFILTTSFNGIGTPKTIFSKYYDANNYIRLDAISTITTYSCYQLVAKIGGVAVNYKYPEYYCPANEVNSVTMRFTDNYIIIRLNDHDYGFVRPDTSSEGQPICLGALYTGSASQYIDAKFFDFEIGIGDYSAKNGINRHELLSTSFTAKEYDKWTYLTEIPNGAVDDTLRQEPNLITINDTLFMYYTRTGGISMVYSLNGSTWSNPVYVTGIPENLQRPFAYYESDTLYIFTNDQSDGDIRIYKSTNFRTFTGYNILIDSVYGVCENSCIIKDGNTYKGFVDVTISAGYWKPYPIEGTSLYNMSYKAETYPTTIKYTNIHGVAPVIYDIIGGVFMYKSGNSYYLWAHTNPPSTIWTFKSDNYYDNTWQRLNDYETFTLDSEWSDDQKADISICEFKGKTYAATCNSTETPAVHGNTSIYVYDGTMDELVHNLEITIE